jgi:hypothetical protein
MTICLVFKEGDMSDNVTIYNCEDIRYEKDLIFITISETSTCEHITAEKEIIDGIPYINWHKNGYSSGQVLCFTVDGIKTYHIEND